MGHERNYQRCESLIVKIAHFPEANFEPACWNRKFEKFRDLKTDLIDEKPIFGLILDAANRIKHGTQYRIFKKTKTGEKRFIEQHSLSYFQQKDPTVIASYCLSFGWYEARMGRMRCGMPLRDFNSIEATFGVIGCNNRFEYVDANELIEIGFALIQCRFANVC